VIFAKSAGHLDRNGSDSGLKSSVVICASAAEISSSGSVADPSHLAVAHLGFRNLALELLARGRGQITRCSYSSEFEQFLATDKRPHIFGAKKTRRAPSLLVSDLNIHSCAFAGGPGASQWAFYRRDDYDQYNKFRSMPTRWSVGSLLAERVLWSV